MRERTKHRINRRLPLFAVLILFSVVFLGTIGDYGVGWDCWEYHVGDKNLAFFLKMDPGELDYTKAPGMLHARPDHPDLFGMAVKDYRTPVAACPHEIWPLGSLMSSVSKYVGWCVLGMDVIDAHNLFIVVIAVLILWALWELAAGVYGCTCANAAVLFLAVHPRFIANVHVNFKDIPGMLFFSLCCILFYRAVKCRRPGALWWSAAFWGLGMATSSMALTAPLVLVPWFGFVLAFDRKLRHQVFTRKWLLPLGLYAVVGIGVSLVCWPFLLIDFPVNMSLYIDSIVERGTGGRSEASILAVVRALAMMPLSHMAFGFVGFVGLCFGVARKRLRPVLPLLLVLWMSVPIIRLCLPGAVDFDGLRHWIQVLFPLALIAGLGVAIVARGITKRVSSLNGFAVGTVLAVVAVSPLVVWNYRAHPNQLCFYNAAIGGLGGAQKLDIRDAGDYWGQSYRQAIGWLNKNAAGNSFVTFPAAEHIAAFVRLSWLRNDMGVLSLASSTNAEIRSYSSRSDVYVVVNSCRGPSRFGISDLYSQREPVHVVRLDGGDVLRIYRLGPRPSSGDEDP